MTIDIMGNVFENNLAWNRLPRATGSKYKQQNIIWNFLCLFHCPSLLFTVIRRHFRNVLTLYIQLAEVEITLPKPKMQQFQFSQFWHILNYMNKTVKAIIHAFVIKLAFKNIINITCQSLLLVRICYLWGFGEICAGRFILHFSLFKETESSSNKYLFKLQNEYYHVAWPLIYFLQVKTYMHKNVYMHIYTHTYARMCPYLSA